MNTEQQKMDKISITFEDALRLMFTYQLIFQTPFRNEQGAILKGFTFTRDEIERILFVKDQNGDFVKDQNGEYVKTAALDLHIALGHHYGDDDPTQSGVQVLNRPTSIAFGLGQNNKALVDSNTVFNYCDPCPSRCPDYSEVMHIVTRVLEEHFPGH